MNESVIAIDVGTTNIKSALFDCNGKVLKLVKCSTPLEKKENGTFYGAEAIWKVVSGQIIRLLVVAENVKGICVTGMAEAGLVMDKKTGKALTDIMPWFDPRTKELATAGEKDSEAVFETTGLWNSFKYGIYKYLWLLREYHLEKADTIWLSMCDYVTYRLTGNYVTDPTFAARTYMYHVIEHRWDEKRIQNYGLKLENFPVVIESGKAAGTYKEIPVAIGGHDHICAAFGLLYHHPQEICDSAGTSETYVGKLNQENIGIGFPDQSGLLYGPFVEDGFYFMGNVPSSGHSVEWFRKNLQIKELDYPQMNQALEELPKEPGEILYFPYLTGMGAPWYRTDARGMFLGLSESSKGIQVLKAILEGIQYQGKWLLHLVETYHKNQSKALICAGGSVHNHTMMQCKADVLRKEVLIPEVTEATLCGAAALFLKKNCGAKTAENFLRQAVQIKNEYKAEEKRSARYEEIFVQRYLPFIEIMNEKKLF